MRNRKNRSLCEALESRTLYNATIYPTDASSGSAQTQRSEIKELVIVLGTADSGFDSADITIAVANGDGSGANDGSANTDISGTVLGTPTTSDDVTWLVPIVASTSYTTSAGSLDNGIYDTAVTSSGGNGSAAFFRLYGSIDGSPLLTSGDDTDFSDAYGTHTGDPGFNPDLDDTGVGAVNNTDAYRFGHDGSIDYLTPTVTTAATASTGTVTGTTVGLSAAGASGSYSGADLTYTWTATAVPAGVAAPTYSDNGDNSASSTTATFYGAGSYEFAVTITDPAGRTVYSDPSVTVQQAPTTMSISSGASTLGADGTTSLTYTVYDQFGNFISYEGGSPMWVVNADGSYTATGEVSYSGASYVYYAPSTAGGDNSVTASLAGVTSNTLTIYIEPPIFVTGAAGTVVDTTSGSPPKVELDAYAFALSGPLTYTWSVYGTGAYPNTDEISGPVVAGEVPIGTFDIYNGTVYGGSEQCTMNTCGTWAFTCTAADAYGNWATSTVYLNVPQKFTTVFFPTATSCGTDESIGMLTTTAPYGTCQDQFGVTMLTTPTSGSVGEPLDWSILYGTTGSINTATGVYTAGSTDGYADIELDWTNAYGVTGTNICDVTVSG